MNDSAFRTTPPNVLTLANSDKIVVIGNSYSESSNSPPHKSWIAKLNTWTSWYVENFAQSGGGLPSELELIRRDSDYFGAPFRDYGACYALIMSWQNDVGFNSIVEIRDTLIALVQTVRGFGLIPILCTEWRPAKFAAISRIDQVAFFSSMADELGCAFIDTRSNGHRFAAAEPRRGDYLTTHPGVRTNELIRAPIEDFIERELPPIGKRMKISRRHPNWVASSLDDLVWRTKEEFAARFQPLRVGEKSLDVSDGSMAYVDRCDLDQEYARTLNQSEVLRAMKGEPIAFDDYLLIDCVLDVQPNNLQTATLVLSSPDVKVCMLDATARPYNSSRRYQAFYMPDADRCRIGDTYVSSDPAMPGSWTVAGAWNGALQTRYRGPDLRGAAGSLTRIAGDGPATLAYTRTTPANDQAFYEGQGRPKGHWIKIIGEDGRFTVSGERARSCWHGDSLLFLVYHPRGGRIGAPILEYTGALGKQPPPKPTHRPVPRGAPELLVQPYCHTLAGWTVTTGAPVPSDLADDDGQLPRGTSGVMLMADGDRLLQRFVPPGDDDEAREIEVTIWARYSPPRHVLGSGVPAITEKSYDWNMWEISLLSPDALPVADRIIRKQRGDLWWRNLTCRVRLEPGTTVRAIEVGPIGKHGQLAKVSIRPVD